VTRKGVIAEVMTSPTGQPVLVVSTKVPAGHSISTICVDSHPTIIVVNAANAAHKTSLVRMDFLSCW
jgi:hypothetical protein